MNKNATDNEGKREKQKEEEIVKATWKIEHERGRTILLENISAPTTCHSSSLIQSNLKFLCCITIYIFLAFFCHQAQLSSSNRLEMRAK